MLPLLVFAVLLSSPPDDPPSGAAVVVRAAAESRPPAPILVAPGQQHPPTVRQFEPRLWEVSILEAIYIALENNRSIAVEQLLPERLATRVAEEQALFTPQFVLGAQFQGSDVELSSTVDTAGTGVDMQGLDTFGTSAGQPVQLGLSKRLLTGGTLRAEFGTGFTNQEPAGVFATLNPFWRSTTAFSLEQPLWRGAGRTVNETQIVVARADYRQSEQQFRVQLNDVIRGVEFGYWTLAVAHHALRERRRAMDYTLAVLNKELERQELGESSRPQVGQAREQYQRTRIDYLDMKNRLLEAERRLRQIMGLPGFDGRRITVPKDIPEPDVNLAWEHAVDNLFLYRPELASQREAIRAAEAQYRYACNMTRPDVNLIGNYTLPGLASKFDQSIDKMFTDGTYEWTLGIEYRRNAGQIGEQAQLQNATIELRRQQLLLRKVEFDLLHQLQAAYQELTTARERTLEARELREAAAERLVAQQEYYDLGHSGLDLLLRSQSSYTDAQLEELQSHLQLRMAESEWRYAQGLSMALPNFHVSDTLPEPRQVEPIRPGQINQHAPALVPHR